MSTPQILNLTGRQVKPEDFLNVINHIILPPKLPHSEDKSTINTNHDLLQFVQDVMPSMNEHGCLVWKNISDMLRRLGNMQQTDEIDRKVLELELPRLKAHDCIALYLPAQNAGLLITHKNNGVVSFEASELSASYAATMTTTGSLLRAFPGRAVCCPMERFLDDSFQLHFTSLICRLHGETVELCAPPIPKKQGSKCEEHDSTDPRLVTDCLMTILSAIGQNEETSTIQKSIRDEILWEGTSRPWRRSPFWLFLKVVIVRTLMANLDPEEAQKQYKLFMIEVVARLLDLTGELEVPPDLLSVIHAKLSRKLLKFERQFGQFSSSSIEDVSQKAQQTLDDVWKRHSGAQNILRKISVTGWEDSTHLLIPNSRKILKQAREPLDVKIRDASFVPQYQQRISQDPKQLPTLKPKPHEEHLIVILADVETWVGSYVAEWAQEVTASASKERCDTVCDNLFFLMNDYWTLATKTYECNPLEISNAILVVTLLWVALDKICVWQIPHLGNYPPEIDPAIFRDLLLPKAYQMYHLDAIEEHIRRRQDKASLHVSKIFAPLAANSFGVWWYDSSEELKDLCKQIQISDQEKKDAKLEDLESDTKKYTDLLNEAEELSHSSTENKLGDKYHSSISCQKCILENKARQMTIDVDESSLPEDEVQRKTVVFELAVPVAFAAWRDATFMILSDIGQQTFNSGMPMHVAVLEYSQLRPFVAKVRRQPRVSIGSKTKSFIQANYCKQKFPTTEDKICVKNGLQYDVWNMHKGCWVSQATDSLSFKHLCTIPLPEGIYDNLGWAVRTSKHSTNEVMAKQSECNQSLEARAFIAFCSLRAGERIQWINIIRELDCSNLDHNNHATVTLFLQAIWEAGTSSDGFLREAHALFEDSTFRTKLIGVLERRIKSIESNWKQQWSMTVVIQLTLRLLSLTSDAGTRGTCIRLLSWARNATLEWCQQLQNQMHHTSTAKGDQTKTVSILLGAALLCYSTYDVDKRDMSVSLNSAHDLSIAIKAQAIIHDSIPFDRQILAPLLQMSLLRSSKIAHKLEPFLSRLILEDPQGINRAVQNLCNGISLQSKWHFVSLETREWVYNKTGSIHGRPPQEVHYNLLVGELLVGGKPIGKIPNDIKHKSLFQQIFGPAALHVFTSDMPGMDYRVSQPVQGNEVHVGIQEGEVLIKARFEKRVLQALPQETFSGELPAYFVKSFTHWLDEESGEVEFRPINTPWISSKNNWRLVFSGPDITIAVAEMGLNQKRLVDLASGLGKSITDVLEVLDPADNCHVFLDQSQPDVLEVDLPRYNLLFHVTQSGNLTSVDHNAIVDPNQDIGTLVGLRNKLVLLDDAPEDSPRERSLIVPYGEVDIEQYEQHVQVNIERGAGPKQKYFLYKLDRHLRTLRGVPDVLSSVYKAYLHAITSFCRPDPFTERTGIEEAIEMLKQASLFSTSPLNKDETSLLSKIAALTPQREYFSPSKHYMNVCWNPKLPSLSQHDDFLPAAKAILRHHSKTEILYDPQATPFSDVQSAGNAFLHDRARKRNSSVMRSALVSDVSISSNDDRKYLSRDLTEQDIRASQTYEVARLIEEWPSSLATRTSTSDLLTEWGNVCGYHKAFASYSLQELTTLQLKAYWGSLYQLCRSSKPGDYHLLFTLGIISFGADPGDLEVVRTLLAFAFEDAFTRIDPPEGHDSYDLTRGAQLSMPVIEKVVRDNTRIPRGSTKARGAQLVEQNRRKKEAKAEIKFLCQQIFEQWPVEKISCSEEGYNHVRISEAIQACQDEFDHWHKNGCFLAHLAKVDAQLAKMQAPPSTCRAPDTTLPQYPRARSHLQLPSLEHLLRGEGRAALVLTRGRPQLLFVKPAGICEDASSVADLIDRLRVDADKTREVYLDSLDESYLDLQEQGFDDESQRLPYSIQTVYDRRRKSAEYVETLLKSVHSAFAPSSVAESMLAAADLWPRYSTRSLLERLRTNVISELSKSWKDHLLILGDRIAVLQRFERMAKAYARHEHAKVWRELKYKGRDGWEPNIYPGWLLMEIESNITIRPVQVKVAQEMINPRSNGNCVLQLNMGEGKSSVIIPMIASALADGQQLTRVVVLKSLLPQTLEVLTRSLGGLLDQRICHIPFTRKTKIDISTIGNIDSALKDYERNRGIMVTLPDEILSMRLTTRESMTPDPALAYRLLNLQDWQAKHCRDVIDESDEILGVRSQLIYPVGNQQMLDGKSDRWLVSEALLQRVKFHSTYLAEQSPSQIEVDFSGKSFPSLNILSREVFDQLVELLVQDTIDGRLDGISFDFCNENTRTAIKNFISVRNPTEQDVATVTRDCSESPNWNSLLIIRGLLTHGILQFVLQSKRWLVEYGLSIDRCLMAVPFLGKGKPSPNSEFGHPDVAILLTILSYYYEGLTIEQMYDCFTILSKNPDAQDIYASWVSASESLPWELKAYGAVNLEDRAVFEGVLFHNMQFNLRMIDYFLNQVVFPKEGREFAKKISLSGWDIPSSKTLTTGFSGTNDNRSLLPYSIEQKDLPGLKHTSAMVINRILRDGNSPYIRGFTPDGKKLSVSGLLELICSQDPRISVLIDVGAYVLEATNLQVVQLWLELEKNAKAAIYYNAQDEAMVLDRNGEIMPLRVSSFYGGLDRCIVYLDESHSRGIDLPIPKDSRAALTLGPRLVKDRLLQAASRMRLLGNGHEVCFVSPPEVHQSICNMGDCDNIEDLTATDVLAWSIKQSCQTLDVSRPLRIMQGAEFLRQQKILDTFFPAKKDTKVVTREKDNMKKFWQLIQEDEAQKLSRLYGIEANGDSALESLLKPNSSDEVMQELVREFEAMRKTSTEFSNVDNEHEREVMHEIEQECQVERTFLAQARPPKLSKGLEKYIETGNHPDLLRCAVTGGVSGAFRLFQNTTAQESFVTQEIKSQFFKVFMTEDFANTLEGADEGRVDSFLFPVTWILRSLKCDILTIISAYEANMLLPQILNSRTVRLHTYAAKVSKHMIPFDHMDFFTTNSQPEDGPYPVEALQHLDLFAGSLYLQSPQQYEEICRFLGLITRNFRAEDVPANKDGFVDSDTRKTMKWPRYCPFQHSPLPFLKQIFNLRMHGQGFSNSHMGAILNGKALTAKDFGLEEEDLLMQETEEPEEPEEPEDPLFVQDDEVMEEI